jgi:hypothetical protein
MSTRILILWAVLSLGAGPVVAQSTTVRVSASVSSTEVGAQESVTLRVRVEGTALRGVETPEPPVTTNLVLDQSTPSTQRNVAINSEGEMERSVTYRWIYEPMRTGAAEIGPVEVRIAGTPYTTETIRLTVVPQGQRPSLPSTSPHGAQPTPPSASGSRSNSGVGTRDLLIRAEPSKTTVYQNEQVTIEYRLFFRPQVQLRRSRLASAWDANGFWREELDVASRPRPRTRILNGRTYRSIVLKRVAVFPTRAGTLRVDPLRIETEAYATRPSGAALQRGFEPVTIASDPLTIEARPLPAGAPADFSGTVGAYDLRVALSADSVQVGNAVRLRATLQGRGNLATLAAPSFAPPPAFESYAPQTSTDVHRSGQVVRGTKTFTYTLIPRTNGRYTLPPVQFTTFNPDTGTYETLRSDPRTVHVTGDAAPEAVSTTGFGLPVGEVAPLMTEARWMEATTNPLHRRLWMYLVMLGTIALGVAAIAARRAGRLEEWGGRKDKAPPASSPTSNRTAADRHLARAEQALRKGETTAFYRALEQALLAVLRARTGLSGARPSRDALQNHLSEHGVPPADRDALGDLLDACEDAQFTPETPAHDRAASDLSRTRRVLRRLDDVLPAPPRSGA